jgi:hypothetical protein
MGGAGPGTLTQLNDEIGGVVLIKRKVFLNPFAYANGTDPTK